MGEYPFIKFFPSDFLAASAGLSAAETGIFIKLLCQFYDHDGPIKRDDTRLARVCGCTKPTLRKSLTALIDSGTITEEHGQLSSLMAEKQIADRRVRTRKATHAADERWSSRGQKVEENQCSDHADASPKHCLEYANQNSDSRVRKGGGGTAPARGTDLSPSSQHSCLEERKKEPSYRDRLLSACGADPIAGNVGTSSARLGTQDQMIEAHRWLTDLGLTENQVLEAVTDVVSQKRDGPPNTLKYFTPALERLAGDLSDATTKPMEAKNADRPDYSRSRKHPLPARAPTQSYSESDRIAEFARTYTS